jgi:hypothetical protein
VLAVAFNNLTAPRTQYLVRDITFLRSYVHSIDSSAEMGSFLHACEGEMVCESINTKIPYFNAPIYLENKVRDISMLTAIACSFLMLCRLLLAKLMRFSGL